MSAIDQAPEERARDRSVIHASVAVVVFAAALALSFLWFERWNAWTNPIFAARPHPALPHVLLHHHMQPEADLLFAVPWEAPLFALTDFMIDTFGRNYRAMMRAPFVFYAVTALGLGAAAWRRGGASAALIVALLSLGAPVPIVAALGMDEHGLLLALVAWSAFALMWSDQMTRPVPCAVAGLLAGLAMRWAFVPSNGLLAVATIANAAGFSFLVGVIDRYGGLRPWWRMRRRKDAWRGWIGLCAMVATGLFAALWRSPNPPLQMGYYSAQAGESAAAGVGTWLGGLPAYLLLAARHQLGPVLGAATLFGLVFLWRKKHPDRALLTSWLVVPIVALSLIPKRNAYYGWSALIIAPLIIGLVITTIEKKWMRIGLATAIVLGTISWSATRMLAPEPNIPGSATFRYFEQSSMYVLTRPDFTIEGARKPQPGMLEKLRKFREGDERILIVLLGTQEPFEQLRFQMLMEDADAQLHILALAGRNPPDGVTPFFAEVPPTRGVVRPFVEVVAGAMEKLKKQFGESTPISHPTMGYLQKLAEHADEVEPVYVSDRLVVYDRRAGIAP